MRARLVLWGLALVAAYWAVLVAVAEAFGGRWPPAGEPRWNFLVFGLIVSFLLLKTWLMAARTVVPSRLGSSLIAANVALALLYAYVMAAALWPGLGMRHPWMVDALRIVLVASVAWGAVELLRTPDPDPAEDEDPWLLLEEVSAENQRLSAELALCRERPGEG